MKSADWISSRLSDNIPINILCVFISRNNRSFFLFSMQTQTAR